MSVDGISGPSVTVSLAQVDRLDLEKTAQFATDADRTLFLDAIKNLRDQKAAGVLDPKIEIPKPVNADQLGVVDEKLGDSLGSVDDVITSILKVMHELGQEMRKTSQTARTIARQSEQTELQDSADKIRSAAAFALASGVTGGTLTMASGVAGVVGAGKAMGKSGEALKISDSPEGELGFKTDQGMQKGFSQEQVRTLKGAGLSDAEIRTAQEQGFTKQQIKTLKDSGLTKSQIDKLENRSYTQEELAAHREMTGPKGPVKQDLSPEQISKIKELSDKAENIRALSEGVRMGLQGAGQIASAGLDYQSKQEEAQKAEIDAKAKLFGYQVQDADDAVHNMRDMINDVQQKLGDILQAESQIQSKIWS
jgi:hypothetical protein